MNKNLLCIGHSTLDTFINVEDAEIHCDIDNKHCKICFDFGAKIPVDVVSYGIGGGAANVAVGTSKLGVKSSIYTIIGEDIKGADILATFKRYNVGCKYVEMDENPTDQSVIVSLGGERTIFTHSYPRKYRLPQPLGLRKSFSHAFLSSVGTECISRLYEDIAKLKELNPNLVLFYNPGSRELKKARSDIAKLLKHIDFLIANVEEGCTVLNAGLKRDQIEIDDLIGLLVEKGIGVVVLTDGGNGVYIGDVGEQMHIPALRVKVVERTGAGDAFASGFIGAIMHGKSKKVAAKWGSIASAAVISKIGAQNGLLTKKQLEGRT